MMLMLVSMTAGADVKVLYGKSGNDTFTGGKISATQEVQKDGQVAVTFTIKPDNGYTFTYTKTSLVIVSVYDPSSKSSTRADEIKVSETLWPKGTEGTISYPNSGEYTVTVDPNLGVWVQTVVFTESGAKVDPPATRSTLWGKFYIASNAPNNDRNYKGYDNSANYYLCAAQEYYDNGAITTTSNETPFLTTFQTKQTDESLWIVEKVTGDATYTNHYTFKQKDGNNYKYLTVNDPISSLGDKKKHRRRVHLEAVSTLTNRNYFTLEKLVDYNGKIKGFAIACVDAHQNGTNKYLNPPSGNFPKRTAGNDDSGGIIGFYNKDNYVDGNGRGSIWFFEVPKPVIHINGNKLSFSCINEDVTYYYNVDSNEDPSATDENKYNESNNTLLEGVHTIKVIAVMNSGYEGYASGVVTQEVNVVGTNDSYLIQSKESPFYYLIPNLKIGNTDYPKNLTTLNVPCSTMVWKFEDAADNDGQYFYIKNTQGGYLYYNDSDNSDNKYVYFNENIDTNDPGYKFSIISHTSGGFNIIPKGQTTPINKPSIATDSNDADRLSPVKLTGELGDVTSLWDFIRYTSTASLPQWTNAPFTESSNEVTHYYQIKNVNKPAEPLLLNNSGVIQSITVPTADYDVRKAMWVVKKVGAYHATDNPTGDDSELLDYYTFQNAYTGELLYLNKMEKEVKTDASPGMLQMGMPEGADETWSHFVIVQTLNNGYNIIPRVLVDNTKAISKDSNHEAFNCINRANGKNYTGTWYDNDKGSRWTFAEQTDVKCMEPVFTETITETGNVITLSCITNASEIFFTANGDDPTAAEVTPTKYTNQSWSSSGQVKIKAYAKLKSDDTAPYTSASDVVTLLNKPEIILKNGDDVVDENTYTYDGNAKEPTVFEVSIGETSATAGTDYETVESTDYSNNTNASTDAVKAKITLRDKSSNISVWHAEKEFKINPKEVGLTWDPDDSGQTTFTYSGLAQAPTVTATGVVGTDECTVTVTVTAGQGSSLTNDKAINAGSYTATVSPLENTNYKLPDAKTRAFTITQAPVTVTADDKTKGYGDSEPELTATVTGMVNNEDPSLIVYTVSRELGNENGTYAIIPSGVAEQGNYTVTYVNGTLTIDAKKPLNKDDAGTPADGITIEVTHNGTYQVKVTHRKVDGDYLLVEGTDYTKSVDTSHLEYDVVTVTAVNDGNYTGSAKAIYIKLTFYDTTPNAVTDPEETAAAYYATQNLQLSERIEAWYVTSLSNNVLAFKEVKVGEGNDKISYIPANQPVLLFGNSSSTGFMLKPYTGTTMEIPATGDEANILKVVTEDAGKAVNLGEVYVFSKGEFVLTMAGTLTKGKVYLDNPSYNSSSLSRGALSASRGETTGIIDVRLSNNQFSEVWYALDGQKYNKKPTRKGIYLQNGKKVVIK
jgi:hypothetical protein